jgi:hypothetical protein
MKPREIIDFKLVPALRECELHQARARSAWVEAVEFPALQEQATTPLTDSQIRTLDQLLFRFGKLQDAIGTRLLPALLQLLQEWQDNEPFLDKLNRAEKLGMLPSVEQWQWLRELRDQTAHEYPDNPALMIENLRRLVSQVPVLLELHRHLASVAEARLAVISDTIKVTE